MKPIHEIFSAVQNDLHDLGAERVQPAEYVDIFKLVCFEIHAQTDVAIARISKDIPSTPPVTIPNPESDINLIHPGGALIRSIYRVLRSGTLDSATNTIIGGMEMREYSREAILQAQAGNRPHVLNDYNTDSGNLLRMFSTSMASDTIRLTLAVPSAWNERIDVDVYMYESVSSFARLWSGNVLPANSVPQWMADAIESGMRYRIIEKLFLSGSDKAGARMSPANERWRYHLTKLKEYLHDFKDRRSPLQIQPMKWLSE
jgi:hypothetical protein